MADDIAQSLKQIADLLRQQVELAERAQKYQEDRYHESAERLAKLKDEMPKIEMPEIPQFDTGDLEEREEEDRQARRQFEERLLAELERHNSVLERILARLEQGG